MPRTIVRDLNEAPDLRPASRPLDTYVRPPAYSAGIQPSDAAARSAQALADSLQVGSNSLFQANLIRHQEEIDREFQAGRQAFDTSGNRQAFSDAVKAGQIPAGANPWFIKGYNQQYGNLIGAEYRAGLNAAWQTSDVRESDDPAAVSKFIGEYRSAFLKDKLGEKPNPDIIEGMTPLLREAQQALLAHHVAYRQHEVEKRALENTGREIGLFIDNARERALTVGPDGSPNVDYESIGAVISMRTKDYVRDGLSGSKLNETILDAVRAKAIEAMDPYMMEGILKHIKTPGGSLLGTTKAQEVLFQTNKYIRDQQRDDIRWGWSAEAHEWSVKDHAWSDKVRQRQVEIEWPRADEAYQRARESNAREEVSRTASTLLVMDLMRNPTKPLNEGVMGQLNAVDPRSAVWVMQVRENLLDSREKVREDDSWIQAQYADMLRDPRGYDPRRIIAGAAARKIDTARMVAMIHDHNNRKDEETGPMGSREFKGFLQGLHQAVGTDVLGRATGSSQANAVHAMEELQDHARAYLAGNQNVNEAVFRNEMRKKRDELIQKYNEIGSDSSVKSKTTPAGKAEEQIKEDEKAKSKSKGSPSVESELKNHNRMKKYIVDEMFRAQSYAPGEYDARRGAWEQQLADINKKIKAIESLPKPGKVGAVIVDEDTGLKFRSDGQAWRPVK